MADKLLVFGYSVGVIHGCNPMPRDPQGKFALKNDKHRCVRSLRLTDATWMALGEEAESLSLTRADYLEQIFRNKVYFLPSNTRQELEVSPSNTWQKEQTEQLLAQLTQLREENAFLLAQIQNFTQVNALEEMRDQILKNLKLGKQAPGYKKALSALNQFIQVLRDKFSDSIDMG